MVSLYYYYSSNLFIFFFFFFSSRRRHTRFDCDWSSDVCSSDLRSSRVLRDDRAQHRARLSRTCHTGRGPFGAFHADGRRRPVSLESPKLDDRTFLNLVSDAVARIKQVSPNWDTSAHNPGTVLLEAFAHLTEVLLYRLNRLPDKVYVELLR